MSNAMTSTMMHTPLGVKTLHRFGARHFSTSRVGDYDGEQIHWRSYAEIDANSARLANALTRRGIMSGDRVGTFMWNSTQHLEAYLAVPSLGAVLHTLNCRLSAEHIAYIINHAADRFLILDARLIDSFLAVLPLVPDVEHVIVSGGGDDAAAALNDPRAVSYESMLRDAEPAFPWPEPEENAAAGICYTSGTTGNPKGVAYSQKTTYLHALASRSVDSFAVQERDVILMLPSMFHANAWGFPYSGWMSGADMVMPGPHLQGPHLRAMIESARPTLTAMVPTLLGDLLLADETAPLDLSCFRAIVSGGSAVPSSMIEAVRDRWNVPVIQGWGMTETSPMCVLSHPPKDLDGETETYWRLKSGRPVPGIEVRVMDDEGNLLEQDGTTVGELQLRGAWVTGSYINEETEAFTEDGWLRTGDVGMVDARGYVQLTDRTKDVIKSGGEWISSVDLEDVLLKHESVAEVAVVAVDDARWQERPLAIVRSKEGCDGETLPDQLRSFLVNKVAKFWVPEYWAVVDDIPKTSVGKMDKKLLREEVAAGRLAIQKHLGFGEVND
ncbi:MAG: long-chain-fatty-acid--CoA ligase [Proteobacteria bacterium]|nr:long-chain-fatty-acid--CoA ligase [Pseudomonadota bacterium]